MPLTPLVPLIPEVPDTPEVPEEPADKFEPDMIYIVLGSVEPDASNAPYEDDGSVTMFVTAGTVVYVSYMLLITEPLNPPID